MRLVILVTLLGLAACTPEPLYYVKRSALVPHPTPSTHSGRAPDGAVELSVAQSTVLVPVEPTETPGANAGLYVARDNLGLAARFRVGRHSDLGLSLEVGREQGAMKIARDAPAAPHLGDTEAFGLGWQTELPIDHHFSIGVGMELALHAVPYHEEGTCIANCKYAVNKSYEENSVNTVLTGKLWLLPSWREGRVTVYGGLTYLNHPTNTKRDIQGAYAWDDGDEVRSGPGYALLGGGVEVNLGAGFHPFLQIFQPVSTSVASYGPVLGAGLKLTFGGDQAAP